MSRTPWSEITLSAPGSILRAIWERNRGVQRAEADVRGHFPQTGPSLIVEPASSLPGVKMTVMAQPPKKQRARRGEPAPHDSTLVVRGDLLDPEALREDAGDNFEIYGYWGVSVFAEMDGYALQWIAETSCRRLDGWCCFELATSTGWDCSYGIPDRAPTTMWCTTTSTSSLSDSSPVHIASSVTRRDFPEVCNDDSTDCSPSRPQQRG